MTYAQALSYIHSVSGVFCKPGLERITELCSGLGNPQNRLKFIHIGGTNGKGSVSSMTASILHEAGYRVGLYTSPYVLKFNERIRVNGENIGDDTLAELTEAVKAVADKMTDKPTEFEIITAIAFLHFVRESCDFVVLEVGLGGRFDATNIIESPVLSVITGIALDHTAILGDTIEKIAFEKAGIIKNGRPVLYGGNDESAAGVIKARADQCGSVMHRTDYSMLREKKSDLEGSIFGYRTRKNVTVRMLGEYQMRNAAIALDAVEILRDEGIKISEDAIKAGLASAIWPARFEIIHRDPLVIFDGAHNPQGIKAAVGSIKKYFNDKVVVFTGVLADKDCRYIAESISEIAHRAVTITPSNPRALTAEDYADLLGKFGVDATPCKNTEEAIMLGASLARTEGCALCCLGSLYTYQSVMDAISKI